MKGKVCLVTGASRGIGRATAAALARLGATVILACRDKERGEAAKTGIVSATGNSSVEVMLVDLASQDSIRRAAAALAVTHDRLDVLINNAAVYKSTRALTPDGVEAMFATNHLGPFLLTNLLLDALRAGGAARVLNITAPSTVRLDFDDLQGERRFRSLWAFGASKTANLLFTFELARRLAGQGVVMNAVHPGLAKSSLMREWPLLMRWLTNLFSAPPERAAEAIARLASAAEFAEQTGRFYHDGKEIAADAYARDPIVQRRLWDASAELTKLTGRAGQA